MNPISTVSSINSGILGPPNNFKTLKIRADQIDGRNKSPSLSKSFNDNSQQQMIIKNDELKSVNATVIANQTIDTTNFPSRLGGIPISQLSRQ